ncbi:Os05g0552451 [Oryza sativa Japonica Group]|uniref:Os05g0552451 protein n=1 Tax=Oryza sativa subsp. japonica TaxID=39947 RepID=A0A0P0WQA3_ORYSJ|nr:Os05g0552451 [Oryza sativa Japonica Group]
MIHGKGSASIAESVSFLVSYEGQLLPIRQREDDKKGKGPMYREPNQISLSTSINKLTDKWCPPPERFAKLNVDAGFREETGDASVGFIFRDCRGLVLLAAHRTLHQCGSAA